MAQSCSARRTDLREIQQVLNKMVELNEAALQAETTLDNSGATAQLILNAAGPYGTSNSLADKVIDLVQALDFTWAAEA